MGAFEEKTLSEIFSNSRHLFVFFFRFAQTYFMMEELYRTDGLEDICVRESIEAVLEEMKDKAEKLENKIAAKIITDIRKIVTGELQDDIVSDKFFKEYMVCESTRGTDLRSTGSTSPWRKSLGLGLT